MTVVGEAAVRLVLDDKLFKSQLAGLSGQIKALGASLNGINVPGGGSGGAAGGVQNIGKAAKVSAAEVASLKTGVDRLVTGITVSGLAITGIGAGIGLFAAKASADLELVTVGFKGLLQESEAGAKAFTEGLIDFAARTPFEIQDVTKAAQRLLGADFAREQIDPILTSVGDFAALIGSTGSEVNGFVRALTQIKGKGIFSADNVRQLTENLPGLNAMKLIAEQLGITVPEAFQLMQDKALSADVGIKALLDGMSKFPGAAGAMERANATLVGQFSNLKDSFKLVSFQVAESTGFLDTLKSAVEGVAESFRSSDGLARNGLTSALTGIAGFVEKIGPTLPTLIQGLGVGVGDFFEKAGPGIAGLLDKFSNNASDIFSGIGTGFSAIASAVSSLIDALNPLLIILNAMPPSMVAIIGQFALMARIIPTAAIKGMVNSLTGAVNEMNVVQKGTLLAASAFLAFSGGIQVAKGDLTGLIPILASVGMQLATGNWIGAIVTGGAAIIGGIIGTFQEAREKAEAFRKEVEGLKQDLLSEFSNDPDAEFTIRMVVESDTGQSDLVEALDVDTKRILAEAGIGMKEITAAMTGSNATFNGFLAKAIGVLDESGAGADDQNNFQQRLITLREAQATAINEISQSQKADNDYIDGLVNSYANSDLKEADKRKGGLKEVIKEVEELTDAQKKLNEENKKELIEYGKATASSRYLGEVFDYASGGMSKIGDALRILPGQLGMSSNEVDVFNKAMEGVFATAQKLAGDLTNSLFPDPSSYWKDFYKEGKDGKNGKFDLAGFTAKINLTTVEGLSISDALQGIKDDFGNDTYSFILDVATEDPQGALAIIEAIRSGDGLALQSAIDLQFDIKAAEMEQWTQVGIVIGEKVAIAIIDALDGELGNLNLDEMLANATRVSTNPQDYMFDFPNGTNAPIFDNPSDIPIYTGLPVEVPITGVLRDGVPLVPGMPTGAEIEVPVAPVIDEEAIKEHILGIDIPAIKVPTLPVYPPGLTPPPPPKPFYPPGLTPPLPGGLPVYPPGLAPNSKGTPHFPVSLDTSGLQAELDAFTPTRLLEVPTAADTSGLNSEIDAYTPPKVTIPTALNARGFYADIRNLIPPAVRVRIIPEIENALGSISYAGIPMFRDGGMRDVASNAATHATIATRATAIFGEAGREAFIPLRTNPTQRDISLLNQVVDHFASRGVTAETTPISNSTGNTINFTQNITGSSNPNATATRAMQRFLTTFRNLG